MESAAAGSFYDENLARDEVGGVAAAHRGHGALLLDGFRAEGAHLLPEPPLPSGLSLSFTKDMKSQNG